MNLPCSHHWQRHSAIPCLLSLLLLLLLLPRPLGQQAGVASSSGGGPGNPAHAAQLQECLNRGVPYQRTNWNRSLLEDSPANIHLERVWWSSRPRHFELTVLTQLTIDRLPALFNQCTTFTGPLSAAVYLALLEPDEPSSTAAGAAPQQLSARGQGQVADAVQRLDDFHKLTESRDGCQLDILFVWEAFDEARSTILYPVNTLRNLARMQVRTKLLAAVDVDMLISSTLSEQLRDPNRIQWLEQRTAERQVFVLPAFEPPRSGVVGRSMADRIATAPKEVLATMWQRKLVQQFKIKVFVRGHGPTQYPTFLAATAPYAVEYKAMFEPWFITTWDTMAWWDTRFRGYGLNKIQHVASTVYYNHSFYVYDGAWLVHRPHADTESRKVVARQAADVNQKGVKLGKTDIFWKVTELYRVAKLGMLRGTFSPVLDARMVRCHRELAWLQPLRELTGTPVKPNTFT